MDNKTTVRLMKKIGACEEAVGWAIEHGGSSAELWQDCERGDWMGWYLGKSPEHRESKGFYLALAGIIEKQAVPIYAKYNPKETALKHVVKTLRAYANRKATREDLYEASKLARSADAAAAAAAYAADAADAADAAADAAAAYAAAAYAAADAAAAAAYAAADAAAAYAAADAAAAAAYAAADAAAADAADAAADAAAADAADAAADAAAADARTKLLKQSADIFRKYFPEM